MPLGIRPTNDFAFIKVFGSADTPLPLISLLNAILQLAEPITNVWLDNPINPREFEDDKLSILDIKAIGQSGSIYDIEMQLSVVAGLLKRIVFYGCEIYAGQFEKGDDYTQLKPTYTICIVERDRVFPDSQQVHHAFRLTDARSGRILADTLEIHLIELACYNVEERELADASMLDQWLFWLLHAHEYKADDLLNMFSAESIRVATQILIRIAEQTEDKRMYDARERAIRDQRWVISASFADGEAKGEIKGEMKGEIKGEIRAIQKLQGILGEPLSDADELRTHSLEELQAITDQLSERVRNRL